MKDVKLIDGELIVKATAELDQSIIEDLKKQDPPKSVIAVILGDDDDKNEEDENS